MDSKTREFYPGAGLPFITTSATDEMASVNYFDVPKLTYTNGLTTGMRAVYQTLFAIESGPLTTCRGNSYEDEDNLFRSVIEEVVSAAGESELLEIGRRGAAIGFLISLSRLLRDHALGRTWRETMMDEIADANNYELSLYESTLKRNADLLKAVTPVAREASPVATQPVKRTRAATTKRASAGVLA
jgi:hypothetical protein